MRRIGGRGNISTLSAPTRWICSNWNERSSDTIHAVTRYLLCLVAVVVLAPAGASVASAQNLTEWSSETRTILSFRVNPDAVQKMLPAGWVSAPSTATTSPGANLNVTMMERVVVLDPQGKPLKTGTSRYLVLGAPARNPQTGQANTLIVGGLSPEGAGAYGVYLTASSATLERTVRGDAEQQARVQESWAFAAGSGERVELRVAYRRGPVTRSHVESVVRSAVKPEFQRTYRIDQAVDVVRGAGVQDRVEQFTFRATGANLAALFDGSEALLSVSAVPFYLRDISIP
jgi:hypothetical protein